MDLSVVIVNYNVRHFLQQALQSVYRAAAGLSLEVFVVDNDSSDGSVQMVMDFFPQVHILANAHNVGFAKANNQAIRLSKGKYVLLLNPDTVLEESTLERCFRFMEDHPDAGGLGVKMLDGSGKYLPESKRGFPSPWVAFCKTLGLHHLSPRSPLLNGYYLGHLDASQDQEIDVLSGAFMFLRSEALAKSGLLDEAFFMYGEDIDLSYRITLAGYKNYYLSGTRIIHYKGESTRKGSLNYVKAFYQAMIIFARKHFRGSRASVFTGMLQLAIVFRALLSLFLQWGRKLALPILDAALIVAGISLSRDFWSEWHYHNPEYFPPSFDRINLPLYTAIWLLSLWLHQAYAQRYRLIQALKGVFWGTIAIAFVYGFLDDSLRYSRMVIVLSTFGAFAAVILTRLCFHYFRIGAYRFDSIPSVSLALAGSPAEQERVKALLLQMPLEIRKLILPDAALNADMIALLRQEKIQELIFCSGDLSMREILDIMEQNSGQLRFRIAPPGMDLIIGSHSKNEQGEIYSRQLKLHLEEAVWRRSKRALDLSIASILLLTLPFYVLFVNQKACLWRNLIALLSGRISLVGYAAGGAPLQALPVLRPGLIPASGHRALHRISPGEIAEINLRYARDYRVWSDLELLFQMPGQLSHCREKK